MFRKDRHGLVESFVAEATRRRRRSSRASFLFAEAGRRRRRSSHAGFFPVSERLRIRKGILREGEDRYAAEDKKKTQCGEIVFYLLSD
jgi:hypothetical protein